MTDRDGNSRFVTLGACPITQQGLHPTGLHIGRSWNGCVNAGNDNDENGDTITSVLRINNNYTCTFSSVLRRNWKVTAINIENHPDKLVYDSFAFVWKRTQGALGSIHVHLPAVVFDKN